MSNEKLTKNKLDLLIEQMMSEDFSYNIKDEESWKSALKKKYQVASTVTAKGKGDLEKDISSHKAIKDLARLNDPKDVFDTADLQYILDNVENVKVLNTNTMRQLIALRYATNDDEIKDMVTKILDKRDELVQAKSLERQSISQPQIRTVSAAAEISPEEARYTGEIEPLLDKIFAGKNPRIEARMKKLSQISKLFFKAAGGDKRAIKTLKDMEPTLFLSYVMLMDYFAEISKSFDSGSGAYLFEWFLAMLAGGQVTGKETGPGGGMAAVDFKWKGGKGSAKYYATKSDIKQAATGFKKGESVYYIVALKKQDIKQQGETSRGTSDPSKITLVDIYAPTKKKIDDTTFEISARKPKEAKKPKETKVDGVKRITLSKPTDKVPIGNNMGDLIATIYIAQVPTKSFRDMAYSAVSSELTSMKQLLLSTFEGFFKQLEIADNSCRKYSISGKISDANATFSAIDNSRDKFEELVPKVNDEMKENKNNSIKNLDKLIKEVILNKNK